MSSYIASKYVFFLYFTLLAVDGHYISQCAATR